MKIVMFYHSLISDWNHGNAHFLRGVAGELIARGIQVEIFEPRDSWSFVNLVREHGETPIGNFFAAYPFLESQRYDEQSIDLDAYLNDADLVIVHEWNSPSLIEKLGRHRAEHQNYRLFFHDTHHRAVTAVDEIDAFDLTNYDGVLAFGDVIKEIYLQTGRTECAFTWHEAADTKVFKPLWNIEKEGDLVWIGNWGDGERAAELNEFLIAPVKDLSLKAKIYGVRYPKNALEALEKAGIEYGGWLPNYRVPEIFARYKATVHIPRRPYTEKLPGIPTIRPFEALASGIPLVSAPWNDSERLFDAGEDYLTARNGEEMRRHLHRVLTDEDFSRSLAKHGLQTIRDRHTCAHRVDELLEIFEKFKTAEKAKTVKL